MASRFSRVPPCPVRGVSGLLGVTAEAVAHWRQSCVLACTADWLALDVGGLVALPLRMRWQICRARSYPFFFFFSSFFRANRHPHLSTIHKSPFLPNKPKYYRAMPDRHSDRRGEDLYRGEFYQMRGPRSAVVQPGSEYSLGFTPLHRG